MGREKPARDGGLARVSRALPWHAGCIGSRGRVKPTTRPSMFVKARGVLVSELSFALDVSEDEALDRVQNTLA